MSEQQRIERTVRRAEAAWAAMASAADIDAQQAAWEEFVSDWRTALNQISALARKTGAEQLASDIHSERLASNLLDYVWEARNVEEHTADGTSLPALERVPDPYILRDGSIYQLRDSRPLLVTKQVEILRFRDLLVRRGGWITLEAPASSVTEVAQTAINFLATCMQRLRAVLTNEN